MGACSLFLQELQGVAKLIEVLQSLEEFEVYAEEPIVLRTGPDGEWALGVIEYEGGSYSFAIDEDAEMRGLVLTEQTRLAAERAEPEALVDAADRHVRQTQIKRTKEMEA